MTEFLHEVVARRERVEQTPTNFSQQYSLLFGSVYIPSEYTHLIYNAPRVIRNVQQWWDSPSCRLLRWVFSDISCRHRWVFNIGRCSNSEYKYYCMDCNSEHTQQIEEGNRL